LPSRSSIPLVRLSLLMPFVQELDRRGVNTNAVLAANGVIRDSLLDNSVFVTPITVHRFLEDAAHAANDLNFGNHVGESLDWTGWMPVLEAATKSRNLAGFLVRFIRAVGSEASSARHELDIGSEYAVFKERRTTEQEIAPAQNDAFTATYILSMLCKAAGDVWDPGQVRLTVCNPKALPKRYLGTHIMGGDRMGVSVRFPSAWLLEQFNRKSFLKVDQGKAKQQEMPVQFLDALRHVTFQQLGAGPLDLASAAKLVGISKQSLQRRLRANGTTLSTVIREFKKQKAIEALQHTNRPIGEIATALQFSSPTSFTRAFKTWTGVSPREFRKNHRG